MRSLIIEGMDGSGKDTLIANLTRKFPGYPIHERASSSLGGPVPNLAEWVRRDAVHMSRSIPHIYNRHPLISEPIYAPIRPNRPLAPGFENQGWLDAYRRIVGSHSVVVICQPSFRIVRATVREQGADAHMPGVWDHLQYLYDAYNGLTWPGRLVRYNYTKDTVPSLVRTLLTIMKDS